MVKFILGMQMKIEVDAIILGVHSRACQSVQNKKFAYLCNISRKTWAMKLLFCKRLLQVDSITLDVQS